MHPRCNYRNLCLSNSAVVYKGRLIQIKIQFHPGCLSLSLSSHPSPPTLLSSHSLRFGSRRRSLSSRRTREPSRRLAMFLIFSFRYHGLSEISEISARRRRPSSFGSEGGKKTKIKREREREKRDRGEKKTCPLIALRFYKLVP